MKCTLVCIYTAVQCLFRNVGRRGYAQSHSIPNMIVYRTSKDTVPTNFYFLLLAHDIWSTGQYVSREPSDCSDRECASCPSGKTSMGDNQRASDCYLEKITSTITTTTTEQSYCDGLNSPDGSTTAATGVSCVCSIHFDKFCTVFYWGVVLFIFKFILTSLTQ